MIDSGFSLAPCVSIHAAQAGCDLQQIDLRLLFLVSIHAAQAGCDDNNTEAIDRYIEFQFTQPKRAATLVRESVHLFGLVSIHAAQAGCDGVERLLTHSWSVFQFTQPKRAATSHHTLVSMAHMFQFTQPKRAATGGLFDVSPVFRVSIHAAQAGCDGERAR